MRIASSELCQDRRTVIMVRENDSSVQLLHNATLPTTEELGVFLEQPAEFSADLS